MPLNSILSERDLPLRKSHKRTPVFYLKDILWRDRQITHGEIQPNCSIASFRAHKKIKTRNKQPIAFTQIFTIKLEAQVSLT